MGNIKCTALHLCFSLGVISYSIILPVSFTWTRYDYEPRFDGKKCAQRETIFQLDKAYDEVECGKMCNTDKDCVYFVYQPENKHCMGCRARIYGTWYEEFNGSMSFSSLKQKCDVKYKRVCYYDFKTELYDVESVKHVPGNAEAMLCSHIIYSYGFYNNEKITGNVYSTRIMELSRVKAENPCLKVLLSVEQFTGTGDLGPSFTDIVKNRQNRHAFGKAAVSFLEEFGFDGIELRWKNPYPTAGLTTAEDKENLVYLVKEMRQLFEAKDYILILAVPGFKRYIDEGFDVKRLSKHVHFITIFTDDYFGTPLFDRESPLLIRGISPLIRKRHIPDPLNDIEDMTSSADYLISKGVMRKKLIIVMMIYGRWYNLNHDHNGEEPTKGATTVRFSNDNPRDSSLPVKYFNSLPYHEICNIQETRNYTKYWDDEQTVPYLVDGKLVITYENVRSVSVKVNWMMQEGYAGFAIWSLDVDDLYKKCNSSIRPFPLTSIMYNLLQ